MFDKVMDIFYPYGFFALFVGWIFYQVKTGKLETPGMVKRRKQRESEEFASMSPEQQQLHINAKNKVAEFNFSLLILVVTCIFSGAIIYYVNWVM